MRLLFVNSFRDTYFYSDWGIYMEFIIAVFIIIVIASFFTGKKRMRTSRSPLADMPYALSHSLLTQRENNFFQTLKPIADRYGLYIAIKPRMADFIYVTGKRYGKHSHFHSYFNKISSKHVDFLLCDSKTSRPIFAFELDDKTHMNPKRITRDSFVDRVYEKIGLSVFHIYTYSYESLDKQIHEILINSPILLHNHKDAPPHA
jgi:hypothetical protein